MRIKTREVAAMLVLVLLLPGVALTAGALAQTGDAKLAAKFKEAIDAQRAGRLDEAAAAYAEVVRIRSDIPEVYVNFGLVRYEQKKYEEAVALFERALAVKPSLSAAYLFLGTSLYSLNRLRPAREALEEAVRLTPKDARALMWLGVTLMADNRTSEAAGHLDAAALLAPNDVDILYHRGRAHLKLSQESYQQMFKADPKSGRVHQVLAQAYEEAGREAEAIAEYELTARVAPGLPGIHEALGSLYWKTADLDKAEAAFQRELEIDPHSVLALYKLGSIRVERGKPEEGLPMLEAAIRQNPNQVDAYYYLGKGQGLLGRHDAAIANLQKVIGGEPSGQLKESAYYQLAQIYRKAGRPADARVAIEVFQKLKSERERQQAERIDQIKNQTASP